MQKHYNQNKIYLKSVRKQLSVKAGTIIENQLTGFYIVQKAILKRLQEITKYLRNPKYFIVVNEKWNHKPVCFFIYYKAVFSGHCSIPNYFTRKSISSTHINNSNQTFPISHADCNESCNQSIQHCRPLDLTSGWQISAPLFRLLD